MKKKLLLTLGLLSLSPNFFAVDNNNIVHESLDDDDFFDIDQDSDITLTDEQKQSTRSGAKPATRSVAANNGNWAVAFGNNQIKPILYTDFYLKSHALKTRCIQSYPLGFNYLYQKDTCSLSATYFYNKANTKNLSSSSTTLDAYIDLKDGKLPDVLDTAAQVVATLANAAKFNIGESLALIAPGKIQEHRFGVVLQLDRTYDNNWQIDAQLPFLYSERNLFFTDKEKENIYDSALATLMESNSNVDEWEIAKQHFISDALGFGDITCKFTKEIYSNETSKLKIGGYALVPTAFAIKKGLIGTSFTPSNTHPKMGLSDIDATAAALTDTNKKSLEDYFTAALDHFSANILKPELGNKHHFEFGAIGNFDWYINNNWTMNSNYELGITLPATEQRFYIINETKEAFETKLAAATAIDNQAVVDLVEEEITNRLFPAVYDTTVFPGITINNITHFSRSYKEYNFDFGWNFWYQSKEKLYNISAPTSKTDPLDIENATAPSSSQGKIFGRVHHIFDNENYIWSLSLYTDITLWNSGTGNDFTIGASLDYKF